MPLRMIITTANSVSRVSVGLFSPCSMIAVMLATSMKVTESVRISVPYGSPSRTASRSAWRTTDSAEPRMATNSQTNIPTRYAGCDKRAAKASPYHTKAAHVSSTAKSQYSRLASPDRRIGT